MLSSQFLKKPRPKAKSGGLIGTEARATQCIETNAKIFKYPPQGFLARIEYSLLYNMILESDIYPAEAVIEQIEKEDLEQYFYARPPPKTSVKELPISYAQMTALLVLAGEEWPPESKVSQTMSEHVLRAVVFYADKNGLDRESETDDLMKPVMKYINTRDIQRGARNIGPLYIGGAVSLATANPVPLWVSYLFANLSMIPNIEKLAKEQDSSINIGNMRVAAKRISNTERSGLLSEDFDVLNE